eukprot:6151651-Alexandrium_andersonii.AAC.1
MFMLLCEGASSAPAARLRPSETSDAEFEVVSGSAHFKIRVPDAVFHRGRLLAHETLGIHTCLKLKLQNSEVA